MPINETSLGFGLGSGIISPSYELISKGLMGSVPPLESVLLDSEGISIISFRGSTGFRFILVI